MAALVIISSSPACLVDGQAYLDKKFVEGMQYVSASWDGPVSCILYLGEHRFPFGKVYPLDDLPFHVDLLAIGQKIKAKDIEHGDVVSAGGDSDDFLHLADICRSSGKKLVWVVENTIETKRQIIFLDRGKNLPKKIYSYLWMLNQERHRRRAFRLADGIQANGYPAMRAYAETNPNTIIYLDNRLSKALLATPEEMAAQRQHLSANGRLRLLHSGRLEPLKGCQDIVPVATRLAEKGVDFELDIFGEGSLEAEIRAGIIASGLESRVRLNGAVDFETELVPFARQHADLFLSCHRQSDPSCTYLESMGCGLAVAGYANRMWSALCQDAEAGWAVPMGQVDALADAVARAARDRQNLIKTCEAAWRFACTHNFETEFRRRIDHLSTLVDRDTNSPLVTERAEIRSVF